MAENHPKPCQRPLMLESRRHAGLFTKQNPRLLHQQTGKGRLRHEADSAAQAAPREVAGKQQLLA